MNMDALGKKIDESISSTQNFAEAEAAATEVSSKEVAKSDKGFSAKYSQVGIQEDKIVRVGSPRHALLSAMSDRAEICGFITPTTSKMEISVTRKQDTCTIGLTEKMSSKIIGVIMRFPKEIVAAIDAEQDCAPQNSTIITYSDGTQNKAEEFRAASQLSYVIDVKTYDEAVNWISTYCWGSIKESSALFVPFKKVTTKKDGTKSEKEYKSPMDLKGGYGFYTLVNNLVKVQEKLEKKSKEGKELKAPAMSEIYPLKSSYRSKLLTKTNFIAAEKFETISIKKDGYTPDEAQLMNKLYVAPLFKPTSKLTQTRLGSMASESAKLYTIDPANPGVVSKSAFFPTDGKTVLGTPEVAAYHWYDKTSEIKADEIELVAKEVKTVKSKDGKTSEKIVTKKVAFGDTGYVYSDTTHPAIFAATKGMLQNENLKAFFERIKTKRKGTKSAAQVDELVSAQDALNVLMARFRF